MVAYQDAAGVERTVGPPGSNSDAEDDRLIDDDDSNPSRRATSLVRRKEVGVLGSDEHAILIGQAFLGEQNNLLRRGSVTIQGFATDDAGNEAPVCEIRACDRLVIEDEEGISPITLPLSDVRYTHNNQTVVANRGAAARKVETLLGQLAAAVERL